MPHVHTTQLEDPRVTALVQQVDILREHSNARCTAAEEAVATLKSRCAQLGRDVQVMEARVFSSQAAVEGLIKTVHTLVNRLNIRDTARAQRDEPIEDPAQP